MRSAGVSSGRYHRSEGALELNVKSRRESVEREKELGGNGIFVGEMMNGVT